MNIQQWREGEWGSGEEIEDILESEGKSGIRIVVVGVDDDFILLWRYTANYDVNQKTFLTNSQLFTQTTCCHVLTVSFFEHPSSIHTKKWE